MNYDLIPTKLVNWIRPFCGQISKFEMQLTDILEIAHFHLVKRSKERTKQKKNNKSFLHCPAINVCSTISLDLNAKKYYFLLSSCDNTSTGHRSKFLFKNQNSVEFPFDTFDIDK